MLTESEKQWLERRKLYANVNRWSHFSCQWCEHLNVNREGFRTPCGACIYGCPRVDMEGNDNDVEFEARVAAKLANPRWAGCRHGDSCIEYGGDKEDIWLWGCEWCRLKYARLAVEEEMDGEA